MRQLSVFLAAAALCLVATGQDQEPGDASWWTNYEDTGHDMFRFFNACEGMAYHVSVSGESSNGSNFRDSDLDNAIESRLRAARIFHDSKEAAKSWFNVYVTLAGSAASLQVGFEKPGFVDPYSKHRFLRLQRGVQTWERSWLVQGQVRSGDVLTQLSKFLDEFIANYLRVNNDSACEEYRVAEQERRAKLEADRAAARAETAARWKGWTAEQCQSLKNSVDQILCVMDVDEIPQEPE